MPSTSQLDLTGISWPVCLLKFKQNLLTLRVGERLEVLVQDPEVADHIIMIVDRSDDKFIDRQRDGERFRLCIQKG
jgi:TusA-related sulfurtransferase